MTAEALTAEQQLLIRFLNRQREHCLEILSGLDEESLRSPTLPSGWSALGMIQHLAYDIERFWFGAVILGDEAVINGLADSSAWAVEPVTNSADLFPAYRKEWERSNVVLAATDLDAAPKWWPDFFADSRMHTNREIVLHVLTEISAHAGHLDAHRELIDGRQWFVLE